MGIEPTSSTVLKPRHSKLDNPCNVELKIIHTNCSHSYYFRVNQRSALSM